MFKYSLSAILAVFAISCKNQSANTSQSTQTSTADSTLFKSAQSIFKALPERAESAVLVCVD